MSKSLSKMAKADLVAECKEANLSASGTVKQLRERLLASRASKDKEALEVSAASQQPSVRVGSSTMEAILFENIDVDPEASDDAAADTCDKGLRNVLDEEGLTIHEQDGGKLAANDKGKSIFDRLLALERDRTTDQQAILALERDRTTDQQAILALEQDRTADQQAISALRGGQSAVRQEILALKATLAIHETRTASDGYKDIRSRFLSCYKRRLELHDGQDRLIIAAGNAAAYGGDALIDASLYQSGVRSDYDTFVMVYGFSYAVVLAIRRFTQFKLNARF